MTTRRLRVVVAADYDNPAAPILADITVGGRRIRAVIQIWISGTDTPIQNTFARGQVILEVQKALASYVGR